jgi:hypothetical protein
MELIRRSSVNHKFATDSAEEGSRFVARFLSDRSWKDRE